MAATRVRRRFVDGDYGQLHLRCAQPERASDRCPLICLHMSPKSGRQFARFLTVAGRSRVVVAPDYPGYGESDPPPAKPHVTIEDYARQVWRVVDAMAPGPVDLLGYHTGSMVAAEMARTRSADVRSIVMVSAPVFSPAQLEAVRTYFQPVPLDEAGTRFRIMWERIRFHRGPQVTLPMMAESMAENLRWGDLYEWGHEAAFDFAPRFPDVVADLPHPITVLNPADDLAEQTRAIAPRLVNGHIVECPQWGHGFFDTATEEAAERILSALDAGAP